jgi:copper homeostasis protein
MLADAGALLEHGADGIVFGLLKENGTVDVERCREMLEVIGDRDSVFHRAIDVTPDVFAALDVLMKLGVTRILTSGQAPTVAQGTAVIKQMVKHAGSRIEILPGGGIKFGEAAWLRSELGVTALHAMAHRTAFDRSAQSNPAIYFGGTLYPPEDRYLIAEAETVAAFCEE